MSELFLLIVLLATADSVEKEHARVEAASLSK